MKLDDDLPEHAFFGLPAEENERGRYVNSQLRSMRSEIETFENALALVERCEQEEESIRAERNELRERVPFGSPEWQDVMDRASQAIRLRSSWVLMAARICAMLIHDFQMTMINAKKNIEKCPVLKSRVSIKEMNSAFSLFNQMFPNAEYLRHAAAHPADFFGTPPKAKANSFSGPKELPGFLKAGESSKQIAISCNVAGRTVHYSGNGQAMSFDMTSQTVANLESVRRSLLSSFRARAKDAQQ